MSFIKYLESQIKHQEKAIDPLDNIQRLDKMAVFNYLDNAIDPVAKIKVLKVIRDTCEYYESEESVLTYEELIEQIDHRATQAMRNFVGIEYTTIIRAELTKSIAKNWWSLWLDKESRFSIRKEVEQNYS